MNRLCILRPATWNNPLPTDKPIRVGQEDYWGLPPENHHLSSWQSTTTEDVLLYPGQIVCTTSSPEDTCPHTCTILNQNVQVLSGDDKLDIIVDMMIAKGINGYCLQESWKLGTYTTTIQEHTIFHRGMEEKSNRKGSTGRALLSY